MAKVKKVCIKGHMKAKGYINLEGNYKANILNMTNEEFRVLPKQEQIELLKDTIDFYDWLDNADVIGFILSEVEENNYD